MKVKNDRDRRYVEKRISKAIDAMVDIQDKGYGDYTVARILDLLNEIHLYTN